MPDKTTALDVPFPLPEDALVDYPALGAELAEKIAALVAGVAVARTSSAASNGTDFATAPGIFPAGLAFEADGVSSYELGISGRVWYCNVTATVAVAIDLDGVNQGEIASAVHDAGVGDFLNARGVIPMPPAGPHVANVRLYHYGPEGTASIAGGDGSNGDNGPILGTLRPIAATFSAAKAAGEPDPTDELRQ